MNFGSTSFLNSEKEVAVYDNTVSARTFVSYIAEQAGGFAFIGRDGKLYIRTIGEDTAEIPLKYFEDVKWGTEFKISRIYYEDGTQLYPAGDKTGNTVYINQENMYIVDQEQINKIHSKLNGLQVYSFEGNTIVDPALDIGDLILVDGKYIIYQDSCQYNGKWKASISSKLQSKVKEETMSRTPSQTTINRRVESRIDQAEGKIESVVSQTTDTSNHDSMINKVSRVTQTVDELNSKIQDIADITTFSENMNAKVELDSINESEPIQITVKPTVENISYLYPHDNLYPSDDLFLKTRTIRFTNKSLEETDPNKYKDYVLPDDLLIAPDGTHDEFYMGYDQQLCQITKRCEYNADGTVSKLDKEQIISYPSADYPKIELKDGDYTVELLGYSNAYLSLRLMAQNIYTTQFTTKAEVKSEILQKADEIDISVDKKLSNYSTTEQMNAAIKVKAEEVTTAVSKTYETKDDTDKKIEEAKGEIKVTTDNISLEVGKKVNNEDFTSANILLKINNDISEAQISANKININGTVSANGNFKVDTDGNMTCKSGSFSGDVYLGDGGKVIGGDGLLTNLQFFSNGKYNNFDLIGFEPIFEGDNIVFNYRDICIDYYIPDNFTILSAKIILEHTPVYWTGYDEALDSDYETWGYARKLIINKVTGNTNYSFKAGYFSEYESKLDNSNLEEILNAFDANVYTPSNTNTSVVETKISVDIHESLKSGANKFVIRSTEELPSNFTDSATKTGMGKAYLNVIGYMKVQ